MSSILITSAVLVNIVLMQTLGLYSILGVSLNMKSLSRVGYSLLGLILISQIIMYPVKVFLLRDAIYLEIIVYVLIVLLMYGLLTFVLNRINKNISQTFLSYAPWIIINTLIIGVALLTTLSDVSFLEHMTRSVGTALGFIGVLLLYIAINFRIQTYKIPKAMQGLPIALLIAGLMALAVLGFAGIV
jgi:Na+-translocating ferredoxin:NAD+ oxidoreductase subunit A